MGFFGLVNSADEVFALFFQTRKKSAFNAPPGQEEPHRMPSGSGLVESHVHVDLVRFSS